MNPICFDQVLILGVDTLAAKCAISIKIFGVPTILFDTNKNQSLILKQWAKRANISYRFLSKPELFNYLAALDLQVLIVSAINPLLIPKSILSKVNLTAINCHHALLPFHPGRNAEAWAIFEQDSHAGITWHFMSPKVDAGNIITQKQIELNESITSIRLLKILSKLAEKAFLEIIEDILKKQFKGIKQDLNKRGKLHYSWEVPNYGIINLRWGGKKISAFLRAMDYGYLEVLGKPKVTIRGQSFSWNNYEIEKKTNTEGSKNSVYVQDKKIIIRRKDYIFELLNYNLLE